MNYSYISVNHSVYKLQFIVENVNMVETVLCHLRRVTVSVMCSLFNEAKYFNEFMCHVSVLGEIYKVFLSKKVYDS